MGNLNKVRNRKLVKGAITLQMEGPEKALSFQTKFCPIGPPRKWKEGS